MASNGRVLLDIRDVTVRFGGIVALDGVSFEVRQGQIVGLIGPNGAGKTTLFNCLTRLYQVDGGELLFEDKSILPLVPYQISPLGIGRTFQNLALFGRLTVLDNVRIGVHGRTRSDFFSNALRLPWVRREEKEILETAMELISYLGLEEVANLPVGGLPFGTLKRVELARALAGKPKLLLLDEPAGGLNHEEVDHLSELIGAIRDEREVTVLLVEHHMNLVMQVSDRVVALDFGKKIADGPTAQVQKDKTVIEAYLGDGGT